MLKVLASVAASSNWLPAFYTDFRYGVLAFTTVMLKVLATAAASSDWLPAFYTDFRYGVLAFTQSFVLLALC